MMSIIVEDALIFADCRHQSEEEMNITIENEALKPFHNALRYCSNQRAVCAISDEPYSALIIVEYSAKWRLIEYIGFDKWLRDLCEERSYLIEELAREVLTKLRIDLGPYPIRVTIKAKTEVHGDLRISCWTDTWEERMKNVPIP